MNDNNMQAILFDTFGAPDVLHIGNCPAPSMGLHDLLVDVRATALNRADLLQRQGKYMPPPGESSILGLEMSGYVSAVGPEVEGWTVGDRVCALLTGGGYAQQVVVPAEMALRLPPSMSFTEGAAIPESFLTAYQALHLLADLQAGERVLIHAGASGLGTAAIQLARLAGAAEVFVTASAGKHDCCRALGADHVIDYQKTIFTDAVLSQTADAGVDVLMDVIGGTAFAENLRALAPDGRMVLLGLLGGAKIPAQSILPLVQKRLTVVGSTLRFRSWAYKIALTAAFREHAWPHFATGQLRAIIDRVYPWTEVADAHGYMERNENKGKIVLEVVA